MSKLYRGVEMTYDTKSLAESFNWQLETSYGEQTWSEWIREFADYLKEKADERELEEKNWG